MAMVLIIFITASTMLFSAVRPPSGVQDNNAETYKQLVKAKEALISYAGNYRSLNADGDGPGRLPCPDSTNSGEPDAICDTGRLPESLVLPTGGRFEIHDYYARTRRINGVLVDVDSDNTFWYALSSNFRHNNPAGQLRSSTAPTITLDGQEVVAVIMAPGSAVTGQTRPSLDLSGGDFLEGGNEDLASNNYVSTFAADPANFNDLVISITREEIMTQVTALVAYEIWIVLDNIRTHPLYSDYPTTFAQIESRRATADFWSNLFPPLGPAPDGFVQWLMDDGWDADNTVNDWVRVDNDTVILSFANCSIRYTLNFTDGISKDRTSC